MEYHRDGINVQFEFATTLENSERDYCFQLCKDKMEPLYDSSGYDWDDEDKIRELSEPGTRFLLGEFPHLLTLAVTDRRYFSSRMSCMW
jgi:hypothetical protein